ncbi:VCBS repeat-containing protein [Cellulophaga sp. HaHaR_3_176]|uniref:FG-GAP-like repeat-containing protein n=1 Tax=Cellulophaga sp. HaHaR_3_176 TaxID=1942464 RepID=UPI001C1F7809|nr:FG-GAP-like repeat-containing protein [Cellulophaga sp. HaHaR_3_176]QWX84435.1 VCBS repeat-containing protein [Cellulophaga sp. HaHaR_3_176]
MLFLKSVNSQTTFTENAASYGLDLGEPKDGGHSWSDFDGDGDLDVLVLENNNNASVKSFLMRNNGNNTFTNVQPILVPGMLGDWAERQAAWGDINNDGRPDFMINSSGNNNARKAIQIFIQNTDGTFGDGAGGTAPITIGRTGATININNVNTEGAGFFDFEGDGDLDIFFDSHDNGIELLRNNFIDHTNHTVTNPIASALFTHITTGNGSGVTEFGLNQFATDGDYGTAADVNDDGWVDIFMRKRDENDFFLNQGGNFSNGADLGQASNNNKGANGLWDLDNDGDLDAVWTENGQTQIHRNDGGGVFTALGAASFPGLPQPGNLDNGSSGARIDALAGGDIDNDGDIDIILVGNSRSYLYINQLNSPTPAPGVIGSGSAMNFSLDSQQFNSGRDGEGTTMVDIDDDGDLDIYISINNNSNQLYINNLPAANRNNHLLIDVTEDRGANGSTGGFLGRVAIGTNVLIKDCSGNIISGLRQVNGVYGHGTQQPEEVHFGLPLGENETYIIEVHYPNFYDASEPSGYSRLIATAIAQPSTIAGTNHYTLTTTDAELIENPNAPIAEDDEVRIAYGNSVSVQIHLFTNDSEPDGENFSIENVTQPSVGSVVIDNAENGIVTYTYSGATPFPGTTSFDYTITDSTDSLCPSLGKSDTATVRIIERCTDPSGIDTDGDGINDVCDLDNDNDGILDFDEGCGNLIINPSFEIQDFTDPATFPNGFTDGSGTFIGASYNSNQLTGWNYTTNLDGWVGLGSPSWTSDIYAPAYHGKQYVDVTGNNDVTGGVNNTLSQEVNTVIGTTYTVSFYWGEDIGHEAGAPVTLDIDILDASNNHLIDETLNYTAEGLVNGIRGPKQWFYYERNFIATTATTTIEFYATPDRTSNGAAIDLVSIAPTTQCLDSDGDGTPDALDLDSDDDGCFDALEGTDNLNFPDLNSDGSISGAVDENGVPIAVSGGQDKGSSVDDSVTSGLCDDDNDGVNNANDKCEGFDDAIDIDNDGVPDGCDLDNDNDGILDSDECTTSSSLVENGNFTDWIFNTGWTADGQQWNKDANRAYYPDWNGTGTASFFQEISVSAGVVNTITFDLGSDNSNGKVVTLNVLIDGAVQFTETSNQIVANNGGRSQNGNETRNMQTRTISFTPSGNTVILKFDGVATQTGHDRMYVDNVMLDTGCSDSDGDGIPDIYDLDSDGDGCFDALEGADNLDFSDLNGNGSISGAVDENGVSTVVNGGQGKGSAADYTVTSELCDDDGDGVNNANDKCPYSDDSIDSDNDGIPDACDVDDDNDGISDCDESTESVSNTFSWTLNNPAGGLEMDTNYTPEVKDWILDSTGTMIFNTPIFNINGSLIRINPLSAENKKEALANGDYIEVSFTTGSELSSFELRQIRSGWYLPNKGDSYRTATAFTKVGSNVWNTLSTDVLHTDDGSAYARFQHIDGGSVYLEASTEYSFRIFVYGKINDASENYSVFDDLAFDFTACRTDDLDGDGSPNHLDDDSDSDGCNDADEAYADVTADSDNNGMYGSGTPAVNSDGSVIAANYNTPADGDSNGDYDFLQVATAPTITQQPTDANACPGGSTTFTIMATGSDGYQWQQLNSGTWTDLTEGGIYSGTDTSTLSINNLSLSDDGNSYRVVTSNSAFVCEETISDEVVLSIEVPLVNAGTDQTICDGESATLTATASGGSGSGYTYQWSTGETTPTITVSPSGNTSGNVNVDYTVTVTDGNGCTDSDVVRITVEPTPSITVSGSPSCNFALFQPTTYTLEVTVSAGAVTATAGTVTNISRNVWEISEVPDGTDVVVTATQGNCSSNLPVTAPDCACPTVNAPVSGGDKLYCDTDTPATLTASVNAGQTVDWYENASGGTALLTGNTSFTPSAAGTYYAEARSTTFAGCTSSTRTAIILTEEPSSVVNMGADQVVFVGDNAVFTATATNSDTYQWEESVDGGATFNTIVESSKYIGTQTLSLTVNSAEVIQNGYRYRVVASTAGSSCGATISSSALLTVKVKTVITNRRITYRVKKN